MKSCAEAYGSETGFLVVLSNVSAEQRIVERNCVCKAIACYPQSELVIPLEADASILSGSGPFPSKLVDIYQAG